MADGFGSDRYEFNHALFANYAAVLSDNKAYGSSSPVFDNHVDPLNSASTLTPPILNHHLG
jgi:hypothetical protein